MLANAIIAAVLGMLVGARTRMMGLAVGAAATMILSQGWFLYAVEPGWLERAGMLVTALVTFQFAALLAMMIRYLTVGPIIVRPTPRPTEKSEARPRG
ncbi:MAG TPA: hypothetical protein VMP03_13360 [Methylomirabilota bacterium]|nr:hypothetical protein [Methylomirabilota bacterium]